MTTMQTPPPMQGQTTLMPLDPSPGYALRVVPIRANLLPDEITSGRNVRRIRTALIFAIVLVILGLGGWYALARSERTQAEDDLAAITSQTDLTRVKTRSKNFTDVTSTIEQADTIKTELKTATAKDLPWGTVLTDLRGTGVKNIEINSIAGLLELNSPTTNTASKRVGTLVVQGRAADKRTIAAYLDAMADIDGVEHVYLTIASLEDDAENTLKWTFSITADISKDRLCGRFTTPCKSGAK
jgi:type IV pilus assembly protein PilN